MGSENLHHKRKHKTSSSLKRKISERDPYDVVLIVCEGEKSEVNYLKAFHDELELNSANIEVSGLGSGPLKIVEYALKKFNETKEFNRIYCVFDKDQHPDYQDALTEIIMLRERTENIYTLNLDPILSPILSMNMQSWTLIFNLRMVKVDFQHKICKHCYYVT